MAVLKRKQSRFRLVVESVACLTSLAEHSFPPPPVIANYERPAPNHYYYSPENPANLIADKHRADEDRPFDNL
jgi:hypothetical protein